MSLLRFGAYRACLTSFPWCPPAPQTLTDAEALISDLEAVVLQLVAEKKADFAFAPGAEGKAEEGQMVALYGLGASPVGSAMIPQVARAFLETLFVV